MKHADIPYGDPVDGPADYPYRTDKADWRAAHDMELAPIFMPDAVVIYQTPDRRPFRQRFSEWRFRRLHRVPFQPADPSGPATLKEPEWPAHRAVTKYL